jgi:hypothetical protein
MHGFDYKLMYSTLFRSLGQEPVVWLQMRPCPNWDPERAHGNPGRTGGQTGHKRDCSICAGNLHYVHERTATTAILNDEKVNREFSRAGLLEEGDAVLAISSILPAGESWIENPMVKIRPDDHIVAPLKRFYGRGSTTYRDDFRVSEIYVDEGTEITAVWAADDNVLVDYTVGTDVALDLATRRLAFTGDEPEEGLVYVEYHRPERFIMVDELSGPKTPRMRDGSEYRGPRFFRVKRADGWVRKHGAR